MTMNNANHDTIPFSVPRSFRPDIGIENERKFKTR